MAEAMVDVETAEPADLTEAPQERRMSDASNAPREKPAGGEPAAKRPRVWAGEDRKRGQRLMGNLLGTLNKFKGEETTRAATAKARQRDDVASKVANKIREENQRMHEIHALERERKTCRIEIDRKEYELKSKELSVRTRARQLPGLSHFLLTTSAWVPENSAERLPLSVPPAMEKTAAEKPKPLFYKPKLLLPEQENLILDQVERTRKIVATEESELSELREATTEALKGLVSRIDIASQKLREIGGNAAPETSVHPGEDVAMAPPAEPETAPDSQTAARIEVEENDAKMNDEEVEY